MSELEIIREGSSQEEACFYLADERARMRYRWIDGCTAETYQRMLERGWRRFGKVFFRPICGGCAECVSLRVPVTGFAPSRSMRRALSRNRDLHVLLRRPTLTRAHLVLYERYHADMAQRKGWREKAISPSDYFQTFVEGHGGFGRELLYVAGQRLLGVALLDILPRAISAVYCFYEPEERRRSLGVFSVLQHVELARSRGIPHVYLGYRVEGNPSMLYKARYRPHEILAGRPALDESPAWSSGVG